MGRERASEPELSHSSHLALPATAATARTYTGAELAVLGNQRLTQDVAALLAEGSIVVAARFPLDRVADAHEALESGNPKGSVVVSVVDVPQDHGQADEWAA